MIHNTWQAQLTTGELAWSVCVCVWVGISVRVHVADALQPIRLTCMWECVLEGGFTDCSFRACKQELLCDKWLPPLPPSPSPLLFFPPLPPSLLFLARFVRTATSADHMCVNVMNVSSKTNFALQELKQRMRPQAPRLSQHDAAQHLHLLQLRQPD